MLTCYYASECRMLAGMLRNKQRKAGPRDFFSSFLLFFFPSIAHRNCFAEEKVQINNCYFLALSYFIVDVMNFCMFPNRPFPLPITRTFFRGISFVYAPPSREERRVLFEHRAGQIDDQSAAIFKLLFLTSNGHASMATTTLAQRPERLPMYGEAPGANVD